jgi:hypothetical protein
VSDRETLVLYDVNVDDYLISFSTYSNSSNSYSGIYMTSKSKGFNLNNAELLAVDISETSQTHAVLKCCALQIDFLTPSKVYNYTIHSSCRQAVGNFALKPSK